MAQETSKTTREAPRGAAEVPKEAQKSNIMKIVMCAVCCVTRIFCLR